MQQKALDSLTDALNHSDACFTVHQGKRLLPLGASLKSALDTLKAALSSGFITHPPSALTSSGIHQGTQILITEPLKSDVAPVVIGAVTIYCEPSPTLALDETTLAYALLSVAAGNIAAEANKVEQFSPEAE